MPPAHRPDGLHHVALWTRDFDRAVAFYADGLGLTPRYQFQLDAGRAILLAAGSSGHVEIFERPESEDAPAEARLLHFALATDRVDEMYQQALAAGATSRVEPRDAEFENPITGQPNPMRVRIAFVNGPDGEVIEFFDEQSARA